MSNTLQPTIPWILVISARSAVEAMNLEQRAARTVGPWWKALAEEPAHNRPASEWAETAMRPLKAAAVVMVVGLAFAFAFHSDFALVMAADGTELYYYVQSGLGVVLWVFAISGVVLAVKAMVSEYRSTDNSLLES